MFFLLLETIFIVILPLMLVTMFPPAYTFRHFIGLGIILYFIYQRHRFKLPPFRHQLLFPSTKSLSRVILFSLSLSILLILFHQKNAAPIDAMVQLIFKQPQLKLLSLIAYPLISVPLQEILFRWLYLYRLKSIIPNPYIVIGISAFIFSLAHLPFNNPLMLLATFILALWWGYLSLKTHSLILPIISHAIIGATVLALCI